MRHFRSRRRQVDRPRWAGANGPRRDTVAFLFLLLLAALQISASLATVDIVWRTVVVSFDNPATQTLDQIALEKPSFGDGGRDVTRISPLAVAPPSGVALVSAPRLARFFVQGHLADRSPPRA